MFASDVWKKRNEERVKGAGGRRVEDKRRDRERRSRDGSTAIDLILRQETPRGKELVLLEMQPAPVEEQTLSKPLSLCLSLSSLSVSSPNTVVSTPSVPTSKTIPPSPSFFPYSLLSPVVSGNSVQPERAASLVSVLIYLSLSLSHSLIFSFFFFFWRFRRFASVSSRASHPRVPFSDPFLTDCILTPAPPQSRRRLMIPIVGFNEYRLATPKTAASDVLRSDSIRTAF